MSDIAGKLKRIVFSNWFIFTCLVIALFSVFEPPSLGATKFAFAIPAFHAGQNISFCAALVACLVFGRKDLFLLLTVLFVSICCLSTYVNGANVMANLKAWAPCITAVLITATASKNHFKELIAAFYVVTYTLCFLTLLSMIMYPAGIYETGTMPKHDCFFFGHRNSSFKIAVPALMCTFILDGMYGKKISVRSICTILICVALVTYKLSVTSFIATICLLIAIALMSCKPIRGYFNVFTFTGLYAVLFFAVVIFHFQQYLAPLFELFGRNVTFTGRVNIWNAIIQLMADPSHALLGYGSGFASYFVVGPDHIGSAHNVALHALLIGGYALLVTLILLCLVAGKRSYPYRSTRVFAYVAAAFGSLLLVGLNENILTITFFFTLAIANYAPLSHNFERAN